MHSHCASASQLRVRVQTMSMYMRISEVCHEHACVVADGAVVFACWMALEKRRQHAADVFVRFAEEN